jgi:hypothetical protein
MPARPSLVTQADFPVHIGLPQCNSYLVWRRMIVPPAECREATPSRRRGRLQLVADGTAAMCPAASTMSRVDHRTQVIELGEGMTQAVCTCGWRSERYGRDKQTGTMDALQEARDAADLHEWDAALS